MSRALPDALHHSWLPVFGHQPSDETHDIAGLVLAIAIHGGDDGKTGSLDARAECRALSGALRGVAEVAQGGKNSMRGVDLFNFYLLYSSNPN